MITIIETLILIAPGVCIALWPNTFWWFRWGWLWNREPTRVELLFDRMGGVMIAVLGLTLALLDYL